MRRAIGLAVMALLCVFGQAALCLAEDPSPQTGINRDTLLYVRTIPPGAKVLLNGKTLGTSDGVFRVEPGVGKVVVELDGHKPNAKQVTIRGDGITRVALELKPRAKAEDEGGHFIAPMPQGTIKPVSITVGVKYFRHYDSITITNVEATSPDLKAGDKVIVKGHYTLASEPEASLCFFTTATTGSGIGPIRPEQRINISKGQGDFELSKTLYCDGYHHVTFYSVSTGKPFGGLYFGTAKQMEEIKHWDVRSWYTAKPAAVREGHKPNTQEVTIRADRITRGELELKPEGNNNKWGETVETSDKGNVLQLMQQGWRFWGEQRWDEAMAKFRQAVQLAPQNEAAWDGLGWTSFGSGKWEEAKKAFEMTISLNPEHSSALLGLGRLCLAEKKYDQAETYLLKATEEQGSAAWYGLARLYLLQGKYEQAEKYAQRVVDAGLIKKFAKRMLQAAKEKRLGDGLRIMIELQPAKTKPVANDAIKDTKQKAVESSEVSPEKGNILNSPGCETGEDVPDHWEQGAAIPGVKYLWDKNVAFEGKASLCIKKTAKRFFPIADWSQTVARTGDAPNLEVSTQVKAQKMTKAILDVVFLDKDGQWISHKWAAYIGSKQKGQPPADHDWKKYSGTVNIPAGTAKLRIGLQVYGPGKVWFDDVQARYSSR